MAGTKKVLWVSYMIHLIFNLFQAWWHIWTGSGPHLTLFRASWNMDVWVKGEMGKWKITIFFSLGGWNFFKLLSDKDHNKSKLWERKNFRFVTVRPTTALTSLALNLILHYFELFPELLLQHYFLRFYLPSTALFWHGSWWKEGLVFL